MNIIQARLSLGPWPWALWCISLVKAEDKAVVACLLKCCPWPIKTIEPFQASRGILMKTVMKAFGLIMVVPRSSPNLCASNRAERLFSVFPHQWKSEMEPGCWRNYGLRQRLVACCAASERAGSVRAVTGGWHLCPALPFSHPCPFYSFIWGHRAWSSEQGQGNESRPTLDKTNY